MWPSTLAARRQPPTTQRRTAHDHHVTHRIADGPVKAAHVLGEREANRRSSLSLPVYGRDIRLRQQRPRHTPVTTLYPRANANCREVRAEVRVSAHGGRYSAPRRRQLQHHHNAMPRTRTSMRKACANTALSSGALVNSRDDMVIKL